MISMIFLAKRISRRRTITEPTIPYVYYYNAKKKVERHEVLKETPLYFFTLCYKVNKKTQEGVFLHKKAPGLSKRFFFTREDVVNHILRVRCTHFLEVKGYKLRDNLSNDQLRKLYGNIMALQKGYYVQLS